MSADLTKPLNSGFFSIPTFQIFVAEVDEATVTSNRTESGRYDPFCGLYTLKVRKCSAVVLFDESHNPEYQRQVLLRNVVIDLRGRIDVEQIMKHSAASLENKP